MAFITGRSMMHMLLYDTLYIHTNEITKHVHVKYLARYGLVTSRITSYRMAQMFDGGKF